MANRYWVGGTASWDATAGTKWALTSGGAGGQAVPTSADDVFFNAASGAVTVTISATANAKSLDFTGFTGTHISNSTLNIYGALTLSASMTLTINGTFWIFAATTDNGGVGWPIATNGKAFNSGPANTFAFNGVGGKWVFQDDINFGSASTLSLAAGTLDTNGKTVTSLNLATSGASVKSLILGSSAITLTGTNTPINCVGTNQTLSAGTSTIYVTPTANVGNWGTLNSFVWNDVVMQNAGNAIMGPLICANFTRTGTAVKTNSLTIAGNLVCSNTFTCTGNSVTNRMSVLTSIPGNAFAIFAASHVITHTDIMDISLIGQTLGSVITSDSFNRANGSLGGSTTDVASGGTPTVWSSPSSGTWNIASNQIQTNLSTTTASITIDAGVRNVAVEAKVVSLGGSGNSGWLLALAYVDSSNFVACRINQTGAIALGYMLAGTLTITTITGITIAVGDVVSLELVGQVILARQNGTYIGFYNIAFAANEVLQGTRVGLAGTNNNSSLNQFDDFKVSNCSPATTLTGCGDGLGNSNIIFPASVDRYAVAPGNWSSTAMWSATSGGSVGASVPLPQDNVFLNASSAAGTYVADMPRLGAQLDCTGFTRTLSVTSSISIYGSVTFSNSMTYTVSGVTAISLRGRSAHTILTAGKDWRDNGYSTTIAAPNGTYSLQDNWSGTSFFLIITQGTFNTNNFNITANTMQISGSSTRTVNLGTSTLSLSYNTFWTVNGSNFTINAQNSVIIHTIGISGNRSFAGGGVTYGTLRYDDVGDRGRQLTITGNNYFDTLTIGAGRPVLFSASSLNTIKNFNSSGVVNGFWRNPGLTGNYASVPDSAAVSITSDIDIRVKVALSTYTSDTSLVAKRSAVAAASTSYQFGLNFNTGMMNFTHSNGTTVTQVPSLVATGFAADTVCWLRMTWKQSTGDVKFYTSTNATNDPSAVTWVQLGATRPGPTTALLDSTQVLEIGTAWTGTGYLTAGNYYRAQIRNNVLDNGTGIVFDADFTAKAFGANSFTESSSNAATVTLTGSTSQAGDGRVLISSSTSGTAAYLELVGPFITLDYQTIQDIFSSIPYKYYAGSNSLSISGNTNIFTTTPPSGLYIKQQAPTATVLAVTGTATFAFGGTATAGNLLIATFAYGNAPSTVTTPSGYTLIDNTSNSSQAANYMFYKIATGGETAVTVTWVNAGSAWVKLFEIAGWAGTPTLDVKDKNAGGGVSSTSLSTGAGVTNTAQPAFAIAQWASGNTMGNTVSITNSFQESRPATQDTGARYFAKPLTTTGAVSTVNTWTTLRYASAQMVVFRDTAIIAAGHMLSLMGVGS